MIQSWLSKRKQGITTKGFVGVEASLEGIAIAHVLGGGDSCQLQGCDFLSSEEFDSKSTSDDDAKPSIQRSTDVGKQLKERIAKLGLQHLPVNWVLNTSQYSLLLVEAPEVPKSEMREAIRWRVQELSPVPVENASLDVFPLPEDGIKGGAKMVYVVVANKKDIESTIDHVGNAQLKLSSIDITEMCLRNIIERVAKDDRSTAILRVRRQMANLVLVRGDRIYLSRQFDLPYNAGLLDDLPEENIVLELQRSLDYFERQMGQVPPRQIIFCGDNITPDKFTENLRTNLPAEPICLQPQELISGAEKIDEQLFGFCVGAVGAALRKPVAV